MKYIGLDIGANYCAFACVLPLTNTTETGYLRKPDQLAQILTPDDHIAAEWTGGIARPWLETALQITPRTYIYHPAQLKADRKHVGEKQKNDFACARAIAKLLQQRTTNPHQPKYLVVPYALVRESYALRKAIRNAHVFDEAILRIRQIARFAEQALIDFDANRVINALEESSQQAWRQAELLITANPEANRVYQAIKARFPRAHKAALTLAAHLSPIERFPTANALVRYCGLMPKRFESGSISRPDRSKDGNTVARSALVQLAMSRMQSPTFLRVKRNTPNRHYLALCAQARFIAEQIWHDATNRIAPEPRPNREARRLERMQTVLDLVRKGLSDADIQRLTGIHASIISRWKRQHRDFAEQYAKAKILHAYDGAPRPTIAPDSFAPDPDNPHSFDPDPEPPSL